MGRPSKMAIDTQSRVCEAIRLGATRELAAAAAGISASTLYRWLADDGDRYLEFSDALKAAEAEGALDALRCIQAAAGSGKWQAAAWLLERRHPNGYGRRQAVELVDVDNAHLWGDAETERRRFASMSEDELRELAGEPLAPAEAPNPRRLDVVKGGEG